MLETKNPFAICFLEALENNTRNEAIENLEKEKCRACK